MTTAIQFAILFAGCLVGTLLWQIACRLAWLVKARQARVLAVRQSCCDDRRREMLAEIVVALAEMEDEHLEAWHERITRA